MADRHKPAPLRFHESYIPEPNSGCWLWLAATNMHGYGKIAVNKRRVMAHRYSWELHVGEVPQGMNLCHKCDTPSCVNPQHLFPGTQADNVADRVRKGRSRGRRGQDSNFVKLTAAQVLEIRQTPCGYGTGMSQRKLGLIYGISQGGISEILLGKTWKHL